VTEDSFSDKQALSAPGEYSSSSYQVYMLSGGGGIQAIIRIGMTQGESSEFEEYRRYTSLSDHISSNDYSPTPPEAQYRISYGERCRPSGGEWSVGSMYARTPLALPEMSEPCNN